MMASSTFLENSWRMSCVSSVEKKGVTVADSVETLGADLRTRAKKLGAKEKARWKKCRMRFSIIKKNKVFQESYTKVGVKKLL